MTYDVRTFELLDEATGNSLHEGTVCLGFAADRPEKLKTEKNQTQTNVYFLDFADFTKPGTYRVFVPGIGTSYPFRIGEDVWTEAMKVSMKGFLTHRSGIELGPPVDRLPSSSSDAPGRRGSGLRARRHVLGG